MATKKEKPKWKKRLLTILFIAINVGIIAWTAFSEFSKKGDAANLETIELRWWMLLPALGAFIIAILVDILRYFLMLKEDCKIKNWKLARRTVLMGRYYDNLTPAAVGGQPFQIFYMKKNKVPKGYDVTIPITGMIALQFSFLILAVLTFALGGWTVENPAILVAGWVGLIFYAALPVTILAAAFFPKATSKFITAIIKFLHKLHIIKHPKKTVKSAEETIHKCADCLKTTMKNKKLYAKLILLGLVHHIAIGTLPFFILLAFGGEIGFVSCFVTSIAITAAIYFVPTPGNAGAAEGSFYLVFSNLTSGYVFWAMITWRLFNYYSYIIMGLLTHLEIYLDKKDKERLGKNWTKTVEEKTEKSG